MGTPTEARDEPGRDEHSREAASVSRLVVRVLTTLTGKGPERIRTRFDRDLITVVLERVLTTAELALVAGGFASQVLEGRRAIHALMAPVLIDGVLEITGRVTAVLMGANHVDPDMAVEVFVLEPR